MPDKRDCGSSIEFSSGKMTDSPIGAKLAEFVRTIFSGPTGQTLVDLAQDRVNGPTGQVLVHLAQDRINGPTGQVLSGLVQNRIGTGATSGCESLVNAESPETGALSPKQY